MGNASVCFNFIPSQEVRKTEGADFFKVRLSQKIINGTEKLHLHKRRYLFPLWRFQNGSKDTLSNSYPFWSFQKLSLRGTPSVYGRRIKKTRNRFHVKFIEVDYCRGITLNGNCSFKLAINN